MTGSDPGRPDGDLVVVDPADAAAELEPTPESDDDADAEAVEWWRHDNERWVVGDAGRQPEIVPVPSAPLAATRPDTVIDGGRVGGLVYRAVSLRGFSHQQSGLPRQDAYLVRPTRDGQWLVGCVADGVSEGKQSHEAADLACREITAILAGALVDLEPGLGPEAWREAVTQLPWQAAVDQASVAIRQAANAHVRSVYERRGDRAALAQLAEAPLTDANARKVMSSTAVVFIVSALPAPDGGFPCAVAVAAGDSSALLLTDRRWQPITAVKNEGAEVATSAVEPLPRPVTVQPAVHHLRPDGALVVITDGLGDPLGSGRGVVGRFLATMWTQPPDLLAFAQQAGFYRRTFTDDRTAVVIWAGPD
jgi:hypothetical protein